MKRYAVYARGNFKGFRCIGSDDSLEITCNRVVNHTWESDICSYYILDTHRNNGKHEYNPEYMVLVGCMIKDKQPVVYMGVANTDFFNEVALAFLYKGIIPRIDKVVKYEDE